LPSGTAQRLPPESVPGVHFRSKGDAVPNVSNLIGATSDRQRDVVDAAQELNKQFTDRVDDPEIATRISQYEMAFRMQSSVPNLLDLKDETKETLDMYGTKGGDGTFAANCLLARRLAERGVRFIQLYHRDWDHHGGVKDGIAVVAKEVDQPMTALIKDLKHRPLAGYAGDLGSEFGRTPMAQGNGRDHHMKALSMGSRRRHQSATDIRRNR
jgi:hypothetical protein